MEQKKDTNVIRMKKKETKLWPVAVCLLLALTLFVFLLSVQKRQLDAYEKEVVVVALTDIRKNTEITVENVGTLFTLEECPVEVIPEAAYTRVEELVGCYVVNDIDCASMVTESMVGEFVTISEDTVLLSIDMGKLDQNVAGTLRAGDKIDLYTVRTLETEEVRVEKPLEGILIDRSYDSSGKAIAKDDETAIAQYITIPIHKEAVAALYKALENRTVEIVKHL